MGEFNGKYSRKIDVLINNVKHVIQMLVYPIEKNKGDYIILLFDMDKAQLGQEDKLETKVKTIQETYLFSMYVDLSKDSVGSINIPEISDDYMHYDVKYSEWRMMIVNMLCPEDKEPVSLMMFDIDFFKKINDTYGHAVGDDVLKEFVSKIENRLTGHDIKIGRWGGEEFVCVCYGMTIAELKVLAEEIRQSIANSPFETIGSLTCSVGLSSVNQDDSAKDAFIRLDNALYNAKNNGRNCISINY